MHQLNGKKLKTMIVGEDEVRPHDALWVFTAPDGTVDGTLPSDNTIMDDVAKAARRYWYGDSTAIIKLNAGYRIHLTTAARHYAK